MKPSAKLLENFPQPAGVVLNYALCFFSTRVIVVSARAFSRGSRSSHMRDEHALAALWYIIGEHPVMALEQDERRLAA
jgi:hypothetical protein